MSSTNTKSAIALTAIVARIQGAFDAPELAAFGPLSESLSDDLLRIASAGLAGNNVSHPERFVPSVALANLIDGLRANGTPIKGSNAQIAGLLASGLEILEPDSSIAAADAENIAIDLRVIAEHLPGDEAYPEEEDEFDDEA